jgi:hypothetical protein
MSKRFMDTEIWNKRWFRVLELEEKLLFFWLISKCDNAGVLADLDLELAGFQIGTNKFLEPNQILDIFPDVVQIDDSTYWLPQFVIFQYNELKEQCKPHLSVIQKLKERGLYGQYEQYFTKSNKVSKRPSQSEQLQDIETNISDWQKDYKGVDVLGEFKSLKDWLKSSGKRKHDYKAFFRNWLKRAGANKKEDINKFKYYCKDCSDVPSFIDETPELFKMCDKCNQRMSYKRI